MNSRSGIFLCALIAMLALIAHPLWREAHASGSLQHFTVAPCRVVDTRVAGGAIPAGGSRSFSVVGTLANQGGQSDCGIPSGARAVFLNVVAVAPSAAGHLTVYPSPGPLPVTSTLNFSAGQTIANGTLVGICDPTTTTCTSDFTVTMGPATAYVVIDVTGYLASSGSPTISGSDGPFQAFTIAPCRIVDTRVAGGAIPAGGSRSFSVVGTLANQGGQSDCGIPSGARAVFLNVVAVAPSAAGHLTVYPSPGPLPVTSTLNFSAGQTIANGTLVGICDPTTTACASDFTVTMGPATAYVVIDVTGYLASSGSPTISGSNGPFQAFTIAPCRIVDTRVAGGAIPAGDSRSFSAVGTLVNQGGQSDCGIPSGAKAVFLNVVAVAPSAAGHLTVYPSPGPLPVTSTLNFSAGQTIANGTLVGICDPSTTACASDFTVTMGPATAYVVIDVTGYLASSGSTSPPPLTVSIMSPASGTSYTSAQTVTLTASASDSVSITRVEFYDGGTFKAAVNVAPYIYGWAVSSAVNGTHSWTAKAFDAVGNTASSPAINLTVSIGVADSSAPVPGTVSAVPQFGSFVSNSLTLSTTFSDSQSAVTGCEYTTNGGSTWAAATVSGASPSFTCTKSGISGSNGQSLTLNMRATSGGGTGTATAITRTIDSAAPTTSSNAAAGWVAADQLVTLTPSDGTGSGVASTQYCMDTTNSCTPASTGTSVSVTCAAGSTCQTYVRFRSTDQVGNVEAIKSALVRIDKGLPSVAITTPTTASTWTASASPLGLGGTASDGGSGLTSVTWTNAATGGSGTATGTTSWSASVPLAAGSNLITITARDATNNASTDTLTVSYASGGDTTPPSVPTNVRAYASSCAQYMITWTGSTDTGGSGLKGYNVYRGGVFIKQVAGTSLIDIVPDGSRTYSYTVSAVDNAGNQSAQSAPALASPSPGTVSFQTPVTYATGAGPYSVAIGDLNGDGAPDLVVANYNDSTIGVLLGRGDGTFQPQVTYATGVNPRSVALADLNGDGKLDVVTANTGGANVSVLLGTGTGSFRTQVTYATGSSPTAVAIGDLNRDGKVDLVVTNMDNGTISVLLGTGTGTFQPQTTYAVGRFPMAVALGDLDGDGDLDVVVVNAGANNASVLLGYGDGSFQPQVTYATGNSPRSIAIGDLNGDGIPDLAVVNTASATVGVLLGLGHGMFQTMMSTMVYSGPTSLALGYLNRDSKLDLVVTSSGGNLIALYGGDGAGGLVDTATTLPTGMNPVFVTTGDLSRDGLTDIVVANSTSNTISVSLSSCQ